MRNKRWTYPDALGVWVWLGVMTLCATSVNSAVLTANWTGGGDGASYNDGLNWDIGVVPIDTIADTFIVNFPSNQSVTYNVPTVSNTVFQMSLGSGSTLTMEPGRDLLVTDSANIAGLITSSNGQFTAGSPASQLSGNSARLLASGGASVTLNSAAYTNTTHTGDLIAATDPGTSIELPGLLSINTDRDFGGAPVATIAARNGATIDLSSLNNVVGARGGDILEFVESGGGSIDLSGLTTISGSRNVQFSSDSPTFTLASLQSIDAGVLFDMTNGGTLNLPLLTTVNGPGSSVITALTAPANGALSAPALTTLQRTTLTIDAGQTVTTGLLSNIDGSRIQLTGGQVYNSVSALTYDSLDFFSESDFFSADGAGTLLNMSSLTGLNFDQDFGGAPIYTISATDGGTINLSGVTNIVGARGGDSLRFNVSNGGSIDLSNLDSITGERNVRFTSDGTALALPALSTITGAVTFELGVGQSLSLPSLTSYDGTGSSFNANLNAPANGSITANNLTQMDDVDVTIGTGGAVNTPALTSFTRGTLTLGAGQTLVVGTINDIDGSRFHVSGGETFNAVSAAAYDSLDFFGGGDVFTATGNGSVLNLSSLNNLNFDQDFGGAPVYTLAARDSGTIDLSGVINIVGARGGDTLQLEVITGGSIDLANLQSITGNRNVRFSSDGTAVNLPALQTIDSAVLWQLGAGQSLSLPALTSINGEGSSLSGTLAAPDGGAINAPLLTSITRTTVTQEAGQTLTLGSLATIDGSRFHVSGGETFNAIASAAYDSLDYFGAGDVFTATGTGSLLDLSSIQSINFDQDFGGAQTYTIAARDSGTVDLSGLVTVVGARGNDTLRFEAFNGGVLDLSDLQAITGDRNVRFTSDGTAFNLPSLATINGGYGFELAVGQTLDLPALTSADGLSSGFTATLAAPDNGTINAPLMHTVRRTVISLDTTQTLNLGPVTDIDGSRVHVRGGKTLTLAANSYDSLDYFGGGDVFTASQPGSVLDLSAVSTMDFNQDFGGAPVYVVAARDGGQLDMSGLVSVVGARGNDFLEFSAQTNGVLDLSGLTTETQNTRFTANTGGTIRFGALTNIDADLAATDLDSTLDFTGSLKLGPNSTLSVANSAELHIGDDYSFEQTIESNVNLNAAVLRMDGTGGQLMEVGGEDLGVNGATSGNFGIGQLVIGQTTQRTSVDLIDTIDNGNRGIPGTEALYLYGLGGPDGLRILNDSALILNGINVYAWDALAGTQVHLNTLFGPGDLRIPFDDGFLQLVPLEFQWSNNLGGDFNVGPNWSDSFVPLGSDTGVWNLGSVAGYTVQFGTNVATDSAIIKTDKVTYDLGGFTYTNAALNATTAVVVGQDPTDNAELTVVNGTLAGPSARVASTAGSSGLLTVSGGGVLDIDQLSFGLGDGEVDVATGGEALIDRLDVGTIGKFSVTDGVALIGSGSTAGLPAGSYTQTDGTLAVVFDQVPLTPDPAVTAVGTADLAGTLELSLDDGFVLSSGDSFQILSAAGITGGFNNVVLPVLPDLGLGVQYGPGTVTVIAGLIGDLNFDGFVGIDDLNLVLSSWNQNVTAGVWAGGDPSGDGFVGIDDLNRVLGNWNAGTAPITSANIPEPAVLTLMILGVWGGVARRI